MKTGAFIVARVKSERLPGKPLLDLGGRELVCHLIDRLKAAETVDKIVLCISRLREDDPLEKLARREKIDCFRGHPLDVLQRLRDAAKRFKVDQVLSCAGDSPFTDPRCLDDLRHFHGKNKNDFSRTQGLPAGGGGYAVSREALERVCALKSEIDTEVWGGYFTQTDIFRWGTRFFDQPAVYGPDLRVTVDTAEDLEFVRRVFKRLHVPERLFGIEEVVELCRRQPALARLSAEVSKLAARLLKNSSDLHH